MAIALDIWQPVTEENYQGGPAASSELADHLLVKIDRHEDGRILSVQKLAFADYAGLETEWLAGTAKTVLDAAITTLIHSMDFPTDQLTTTQRGSLNVTIAES